MFQLEHLCIQLCTDGYICTIAAKANQRWGLKSPSKAKLEVAIGLALAAAECCLGSRRSGAAFEIVAAKISGNVSSVPSFFPTVYSVGIFAAEKASPSTQSPSSSSSWALSSGTVRVGQVRCFNTSGGRGVCLGLRGLFLGLRGIFRAQRSRAERHQGNQQDRSGDGHGAFRKVGNCGTRAGRSPVREPRAQRPAFHD